LSLPQRLRMVELGAGTLNTRNFAEIVLDKENFDYFCSRVKILVR
jgi:hypothetical protein